MELETAKVFFFLFFGVPSSFFGSFSSLVFFIRFYFLNIFSSMISYTLRIPYFVAAFLTFSKFLVSKLAMLRYYI